MFDRIQNTPPHFQKLFNLRIFFSQKLQHLNIEEVLNLAKISTVYLISPLETANTNSTTGFNIPSGKVRFPFNLTHFQTMFLLYSLKHQVRKHHLRFSDFQLDKSGRSGILFKNGLIRLVVRLQLLEVYLRPHQRYVKKLF